MHIAANAYMREMTVKAFVCYVNINSICTCPAGGSTHLFSFSPRSSSSSTMSADCIATARCIVLGHADFRRMVSSAVGVPFVQVYVAHRVISRELKKGVLPPCTAGDVYLSIPTGHYLSRALRFFISLLCQIRCIASHCRVYDARRWLSRWLSSD